MTMTANCRVEDMSGPDAEYVDLEIVKDAKNGKVVLSSFLEVALGNTTVTVCQLEGSEYHGY